MLKYIFQPFYFSFVNSYVWYTFMVFLFVYAIYYVLTNYQAIRKHKKVIYRVMTVLLVYTQLIRYEFLFNPEVSFSLAQHLPFYMCRLSAWVLLAHCMVNSFIKTDVFSPFLFFWGATGLAGIIYPNGPIENIVNLNQTFYIDHFLLGLFPFFLVSVEQYKPKFYHTIIISLLMFAILLLFIPLNNLWGTDYFYLANQSIFGVLFPGQSSVVFALVHSITAFCFFNIYYHYFKKQTYN